METPGVDSPKSEVPYHPDLKVSETGGQTKVRRTFRISGASPDDNFLAYNNTTKGSARALNERLYYIKDHDGVYRSPPRPEPGFFEEKMKEFELAFATHPKFCHPLTREALVSMAHGRKRVRYEKAKEILDTWGFKRTYSRIKFFLKYETYDMVIKKNPVPRGINPRHDAFLLEDGTFHKPLEKELYKDIKRFFGFDVVMKGFNQEKRGEIISEHWNSFTSPVAIPGDAKRFEQCMGTDALQFTHRIFQKYYPKSRLFKLLCFLKLRNAGSCWCPDGNVKFKIQGNRMSGDNDTASGNCLVTAALAWVYMREIGIDKYRIVLDGDDIMFFMESSDQSRFRSRAHEWYLAMGFRMEFETTARELEKVDFCKSQPVWTPTGYVMVRQPRRAMSKDACSKIAFNNSSHCERWYAAIGLGGMSLSGGIPIMQAYYKSYARASHGARPLDIYSEWEMSNKMKGMNRKESRIEDKTRYSFHIAFNITPDEQLAIEEHYNGLTLESEFADEFTRLLLPM